MPATELFVAISSEDLLTFAVDQTEADGAGRPTKTESLPDGLVRVDQISHAGEAEIVFRHFVREHDRVWTWPSTRWTPKGMSIGVEKGPPNGMA